jgi:hypothetical protein
VLLIPSLQDILDLLFDILTLVSFVPQKNQGIEVHTA